ncbi:MAG: DUF1634 domain-containing protein [Syntrophorhabdales bacterium]
MVIRHGAGSGEEKLEAIISYVLIVGVVTSLVLEAIGLFLFYHSYGILAISYNSRIILRANNFFDFLGRLFSPQFSGRSVRLMTVGTAILILTPYTRAVLSVIYFASRRNVKYLAVTLFVLVVLTASMLMR